MTTKTEYQLFPITVIQTSPMQLGCTLLRAIAVLDEAANTADDQLKADAEEAADLLVKFWGHNITDEDVVFMMSQAPYWPRSMQRGFPKAYAARVSKPAPRDRVRVVQ